MSQQHWHTLIATVSPSHCQLSLHLNNMWVRSSHSLWYVFFFDIVYDSVSWLVGKQFRAVDRRSCEMSRHDTTSHTHYGLLPARCTYTMRVLTWLRLLWSRCLLFWRFYSWVYACNVSKVSPRENNALMWWILSHTVLPSYQWTAYGMPVIRVHIQRYVHLWI